MAFGETDVRHRGRARSGIPRLLSGWLLGACLLSFLVLAPLVGLALAEPDDDWGNAVLRRVEHEIRQRETLHYGLHLLTGRALSLCPCTRPLAALQYRKATAHAHTPRQEALVTTERPRTPRALARDALRVAAAGMRWLGDRLLVWVERPGRQAAAGA